MLCTHGRIPRPVHEHDARFQGCCVGVASEHLEPTHAVFVRVAVMVARVESSGPESWLQMPKSGGQNYALTPWSCTETNKPKIEFV